MPQGRERLSERWAAELRCIVSWCSQQLRLCRAVNDASIARMALPDAYVASLPKKAGDVLSKSLYKALHKDKVDPRPVLAEEGLDVEIIDAIRCHVVVEDTSI